jgi:hypothetical protein
MDWASYARTAAASRRGTTEAPNQSSSGRYDDQEDNASAEIVKAISYMQSLYQVKPSSPYASFEEQRAFKHFIEVCVPIVIQYSDAEVWGLSIPQAAWSHPAIKHSLIAVALVNETMAIKRRRPKYGHDRRALYHVNIAIRELTREAPSTEIVISAGLVLQFMESLNNNARVAYLHLMGAVKICEEFKQRIADGERVSEEQADLILNHLDPTLQVAVQFANVGLKPSFEKSVIDHWSPEAFQLKKDLIEQNRPEKQDAFRSTMDARNNFGVAAVKLISLKAKLRSHFDEKREAASTETEAESIADLREEAISLQKVLDHCTRLLKPIHTDADIESCVLQVHDAVLRLIHHDLNTMYDLQAPVDFASDADQLLLRMIALVTINNIYEEQDLNVELGVIPPLFYLATSHGLCTMHLRQQAITCLREGLGDRREGGWTGHLAAMVAEEIIFNEVELTRSSTKGWFSNYALEWWGSAAGAVDNSDNTQSLKPRLYLAYDCYSAVEGSARVNSRNPHRYKRRCTSLSDADIAALPAKISSVVENYGYQGYFSDAQRSDSMNEVESRLSGSGIPFSP